MFRFVYDSLVLNLMFLTLCFSINFKDDGDVLPESFIGRENLTNETREFAAGAIEEKLSIADYPYMASFTVSQYHADGHHGMNCTGVFIRENVYILTAGRCLVYRIGAKQYMVDDGAVKVRYGSPYLNRGGITDAEVKLIKIHPSYFKNGLGISSNYDIGVITIKHKNELISEVKEIKALYIPQSTTDSLYSAGKDRYPCYVVGYGITPNSRNDNSLVKVEVNLINHKECQEWVQPLNLKIHYDDICVFRSGADPCRGDGGAILFCEPKIKGPFGVFGFGVNCGMSNRPAVFSRTDVSYDYVQAMASWDIAYARIEAKPLYPDWEENLDGEGGPGGFEIDSSGKPIIKPQKPKKPGSSTASQEEASEMNVSRAAYIGLKLYLFLLIVEVTSWEYT